VTGGFIVTTPTERGVACSVHALVAAVQVWATSEAMDYETTLACAAPPTVAPSNIGSVEMPPLTEDQQAYLQKIRNMPPPDLNTMIGTPDTAPAPFRVGDRVVLRDWSRMVHYHNKPLVVVNKLDSGVSAIPNNGGHPVWFDFDELRHAPAEDL
jgi:hypothetical protein